MVVAGGLEALHTEDVSESDGLLTKWNGQSVRNQSLLTVNSGTISRVEKDEDIQELKSNRDNWRVINSVTS